MKDLSIPGARGHLEPLESQSSALWDLQHVQLLAAGGGGGGRGVGTFGYGSNDDTVEPTPGSGEVTPHNLDGGQLGALSHP